MTTSTRYRLTASSKLAESAVTFPTRDQKGRATGYRWSITQLEIQLLTDAERTQYAYCTHTGEGPIPTVRVWGTPTRDGVNYGPAFNYTDVQTYEEACDLVQKRITSAAKRDTKRWGK